MKKPSFGKIKPGALIKGVILSDWLTSLIIVALAAFATIIYKDDLLSLFSSDAVQSARIENLQLQQIGIAVGIGLLILTILLFTLLRDYKIQSKLLLFVVVFVLSFIVNLYLTFLICAILLISELLQSEKIIIDILIVQMMIFVFGLYIVFRKIAERFKKDPSDRGVISFTISLLLRRNSLVWLVPIILPLAAVLLAISLTWPYVALIILGGILIALYASLVFSKQFFILIYAILHVRRRKHD